MLATHGRGLGARFWRMMGATAVSSTGDGLLNVGLPLLAAALTRDALAVAGVLAVARASRALCAIPAGQIVDALDRHRVLVVSLCVPAVALGALAFDLFAGRGDLWAVYTTAVVIAACDVTYDLGMQASVADVAPSDALAVANSRLQSTELAGEQFLGPMVGGALFAVSRRLPVIGDAGSFIAAAALLGRSGRYEDRKAAVSAPHMSEAQMDEELRDKQPALVGAGGANLELDLEPVDVTGTGAGPRNGRAGTFARMAEGFAFYRESKAMVILTAVVGTVTFSQAAVLALLVLYGERQLHLSAAGYGLFFAFASIFGVLGSVVAGRLHRRFGTRALFVAGSASVGFGLALMSYLHWAALAVVAMGVQEFGTAVANVGGVTARQRLVPPHLYGRVVSVYRAIVSLAMPIGAVLAGAVSDWVGIPLTFLVAGLLVIAVVVVFRPRLLPLLADV